MEALHQAIDFKPRYMEVTDSADAGRPVRKADPSHAGAAGTSHLFNHHLVPALLNIEMAMNKLPKNGKTFRLLSDAMKSACQAAEICRMLMGSLGFCLGCGSSGRAPVDLSGACLRFLPVFRALVLPNTRLEADLPPGGPSVRVSRDLLNQVLINLIRRAGEFFEGAPGVFYFRVRTAGPEELPKHAPFSHGSRSAYACVEIESRGCPSAERDGSAMERTVSAAGSILSVYGGYAAAQTNEAGKVAFRIFLPVCKTEPPPSGTKVVSGSIAELFS